jgi:signal transduction histidine kinase
MFDIDLKTLLLIISINKFCVSLLLVHFRNICPHISGIKEWSIASLLTATGFFLYAIYPWATTVMSGSLFAFFANEAIAVGEVIFLIGFWKFSHQSIKKYIVVFPLLLAVNIIAFAFVFKLQFISALISQFLIILLYSTIAFELWKVCKSRLEHIYRWLPLLFVFYALSQLFRVIHSYLWPSSSPVDSCPLSIILYAVAGMSVIVIFFYLAIIITSKLAGELHEEINTKNKLYAIISHDLRNPIGNTLNYTTMLKESFEKWKPQETKQWLDELERSSHASRFLLENLLFWSRSQLKEIKVNAKQTDVTAIVHQSVKLFQSNANLKSINLSFVTQTPFFVETDEDMLQIVIRNVISNAIKYTGIGGKVILSLDEKDDVLEIIVSDNGLGISATNLKKIMDRNQFYYTNGTSNEKGSGFGLKLCYDLITLNNGKINIESSVGVGTIVTLLLPKKLITTKQI